MPALSTFDQIACLGDDHRCLPDACTGDDQIATFVADDGTALEFGKRLNLDRVKEVLEAL